MDTNVLSELRRRAPNANVANWFAQRPVDTLFLRVLTSGEIPKGIEAMPDEPRCLALIAWPLLPGPF